MAAEGKGGGGRGALGPLPISYVAANGGNKAAAAPHDSCANEASPFGLVSTIFASFIFFLLAVFLLISFEVFFFSFLKRQQPKD